jgi:hypothetical protein
MCEFLRLSRTYLEMIRMSKQIGFFEFNEISPCTCLSRRHSLTAGQHKILWHANSAIHVNRLVCAQKKEANQDSTFSFLLPAMSGGRQRVLWRGHELVFVSSYYWSSALILRVDHGVFGDKWQQHSWNRAVLELGDGGWLRAQVTASLVELGVRWKYMLLLWKMRIIFLRCKTKWREKGKVSQWDGVRQVAEFKDSLAVLLISSSQHAWCLHILPTESTGVRAELGRVRRVIIERGSRGVW